MSHTLQIDPIAHAWRHCNPHAPLPSALARVCSAIWVGTQPLFVPRPTCGRMARDHTGHSERPYDCRHLAPNLAPNGRNERSGHRRQGFSIRPRACAIADSTVNCRQARGQDLPNPDRGRSCEPANPPSVIPYNDGRCAR